MAASIWCGHELGAGLHVGGEGAADELLAEGFAERAVDFAGAGLPARGHGGDAAEGGGEEVELRLAEGSGERRGCGGEEMEAEVVLEVVEGLGGEDGVDGFDELGLGDVEGFEAGGALGGEVGGPVDGGGEGLELGQGHLVVGLVRIAAFDAGERGFGEGGLDAEDGGGGGAAVVCAAAGELDYLGDVGGVLGADLLALGVGLEVVVAVGEAEAAGADARR